MHLMNREGATSRKWQLAILFSLISSQASLGLADNPSSAGGSSGLNLFYIFLGVLAFVLLSVLLYKQWQKKKREEQHARLLRLFEEDDELELELGLRD